MTDEQRKPPKPGWIPLPNFEFAVPLAETSEDILKGFVKMMLSVTARGVQEVFPSTQSEIQLVMLCKLTQEDGGLAFTAYVPFQELVEFAHNHLPPRMMSDKLKRALAAMDLEIQHQYVVPVDLLTPVVVVYRPASKHVLLTNKNHFTSPQQFLNPRICRTTSGFLSFLGTFMLQSGESQSGKAKIFKVENSEDLVKEGLNQWFRWLSQMTNQGGWETSRIFVNVQKPEEYLYDYDG